MPRVRAVVLNFNGGEHVVQCVEALRNTAYPADRFEVVVIDNASVDGSEIAIERRFPDVRLIRNATNTGFPANNLAMADLQADGIDYVALVNNDAFVEPGWLSPLVGALESDDRLGAACPKILFAPKFHEVVIESATFDPPGDSRQLGVQLHGINWADRSVFGLSQYVRGAWGQEPREGGWFRWLGGEAVIRLALPADLLATVSDGPSGEYTEELRSLPGVEAPPFAVQFLLAAEKEKQVVITSGRYRVRVSVGPEPRWVDVPVAGEPFDVINNAGSVVIEDGFGADRGFLQIDEGQFDEPVDVFNWCGGGVLLRPAYLADAGLFDERFFLYYEDTDLSWRGQALGWRYRYVPESRFRHLHAASSGEGSDVFQFYVERNRLLLLVKNAPAALAARAVVGFLTATLSYARRDVLPSIVRGRRPPTRHLRNRLRSFRSFVRLAPAMLADRRSLRRRALRNDFELSGRFLPREAWSEMEAVVVDGAGARTFERWRHVEVLERDVA